MRPASFKFHANLRGYQVNKPFLITTDDYRRDGIMRDEPLRGRGMITELKMNFGTGTDICK
jgi:hypothetical protein